jgi:hypothetical protein
VHQAVKDGGGHGDLLCIFDRHIDIRELAGGQLVRTHARAERAGSVVMPLAQLAFNPSRETRFILKQADQIGPEAARLCRMLFGIEGRVGQRKLHGIVNRSRLYPNRFVDAACAQAIEQGIYSYKQVKALTERPMADALAALHADGAATDPGHAALLQEHALIRDTHEPRWPLQIPPPVATPNSPRQDGRIMTVQG